MDAVSGARRCLRGGRRGRPRPGVPRDAPQRRAAGRRRHRRRRPGDPGGSDHRGSVVPGRGTLGSPAPGHARQLRRAGPGTGEGVGRTGVQGTAGSGSPCPVWSRCSASPSSDDRLTVVGADGSCKPQGYVSTDSGKEWSRTERPAQRLVARPRHHRHQGARAGGRGCGQHRLPPGGCLHDRPRSAGARELRGVQRGGPAPLPTTSRRSRTAWTDRSRPPCRRASRWFWRRPTAASHRCAGSPRRPAPGRWRAWATTGAPLGLAVSGKRVFAQVGQRLAYSDRRRAELRRLPRRHLRQES